jgi:hypothetical protein
MARPRFHFLTATPLALLLHRRWGWAAVAGTFAGGLFIDVDHLFDYVWTRARGEKSHFFAPLHGWEVATIVALLAALAGWRQAHRPLPDAVVRARHPLAALLERPATTAALAGLAAGMWLHLMQDAVANKPKHAGVYSLLYRVWHGFRRESTGWGEHSGFHNWSELPWHRWLEAF